MYTKKDKDAKKVQIQIQVKNIDGFDDKREVVSQSCF